MTLKELSQVMVEGNKSAFTANASRRAGAMFNERITNIIAPKLPMMVRGYKDEPWFQFVLANAIAGAIIKFGYKNEKLLLLADAGINAASDNFLGSFNLEDMVNDLIDGIDTSSLTQAADTGREATATGLRRAANIVEPREAV